jgi:hypothetical protein
MENSFSPSRTTQTAATPNRGDEDDEFRTNERGGLVASVLSHSALVGACSLSHHPRTSGPSRSLLSLWTVAMLLTSLLPTFFAQSILSNPFRPNAWPAELDCSGPPPPCSNRWSGRTAHPSSPPWITLRHLRPISPYVKPINTCELGPIPIVAASRSFGQTRPRYTHDLRVPKEPQHSGSLYLGWSKSCVTLLSPCQRDLVDTSGPCGEWKADLVE